MARRWLFAFVLLGLGACSDDGDTSGAGAGGTGGGGAGGSGGAEGGEGGEAGAACVSGLAQPTAECTACQDASCCMTASAAATDPGTWTNSAATICREANCWQECGVAEPECGGIVPTPASCADDLYAACCAEVTACAENDSCVALIYICVDDRMCGPTSLCFDSCAMEFPGGRELFDALDACFAAVTCT
jgi:hypothetical protein